MASLTAFHFRSGDTLIHTLDARFKLMLMALASITVLNVSVWPLCVLSGALVGVCWYIHLPLFSAAKELRFFFILLLMVFLARVLSTPGDPLLQLGLLTIGQTGVLDGVVVCWRLILIVVLSLILVFTTRVSDIKRSVAWFFKSVPGVPEKRLATMLGLIVRFIPVIFAKAGEVTAAQHARCIGSRRNPFFRLKTFTIPLLRSVFRDAGNLALAMEARSYSEEGIRRMSSATLKDWVMLFAGTSLCMVAFLM